jgi:two-component system, OmpR family, sensor kinase
MAEELERQRTMLVGAQSELERQVAERTSELAEANRRLTSADQLRVRFLADISHELRTPLTALRGEAEVALRGAAKPHGVYREALSTVVARAAEIGRLVEDLYVR